MRNVEERDKERRKRKIFSRVTRSFTKKGQGASSLHNII